MGKYIVIAGVNGAGKTTLYETNSGSSCVERVNLDEMVREIGSWKNERDVIQAGMKAVRKIQELIRAGKSINQETTLCGKTILKNLRIARDKGYYIELFYVGIASAEIAKERIQSRVRAGGHGIPDEDVERRYRESLDNLRIVLPVCDRVQIFDNTVAFRRIAEYRIGKLTWLASEIPEWFREWKDGGRY